MRRTQHSSLSLLPDCRCTHLPACSPYPDRQYPHPRQIVSPNQPLLSSLVKCVGSVPHTKNLARPLAQSLTVQARIPRMTQAPSPLKFLFRRAQCYQRVLCLFQPKLPLWAPARLFSGCYLRKLAIMDALPVVRCPSFRILESSSPVFFFPFVLLAFLTQDLTMWLMLVSDSRCPCPNPGVLGLQPYGTMPSLSSYFSWLLLTYPFDFLKISQI